MSKRIPTGGKSPACVSRTASPAAPAAPPPRPPRRPTDMYDIGDSLDRITWDAFTQIRSMIAPEHLEAYDESTAQRVHEIHVQWDAQRVGCLERKVDRLREQKEKLREQLNEATNAPRASAGARPGAGSGSSRSGPAGKSSTATVPFSE